jgi:hypothetical protein
VCSVSTRVHESGEHACRAWRRACSAASSARASNGACGALRRHARMLPADATAQRAQRAYLRWRTQHTCIVVANTAARAAGSHRCRRGQLGGKGCCVIRRPLMHDERATHARDNTKRVTDATRTRAHTLCCQAPAHASRPPAAAAGAARLRYRPRAASLAPSADAEEPLLLLSSAGACMRAQRIVSV